MSLPIAEWEGRIESISQEGLGVGTITITEDGKKVKRPVFVPFTVPGDQVRAIISDQKRKYSFAQLQQVITPSQDRVVPLCPHFTICGGCNLQHVSYDEQLRQKAQQIEFLLKRKGVELPGSVLVLGAKQLHNYRRRAKIAVVFSGNKVIAGFRKFHSHDIIPIKSCFIVAPQILELIKMLNEMPSTVGLVSPLTVDVIAIAGESKKLGLLIAFDEIPPQQQQAVRDFFEILYSKQRRLIGNLFFEENHTTKTSGQVQEHLTYKAAGLTFSFLPETFIQSNVATNELLVKTALEFLSLNRQDIVVDLYAGLGNISLPVAKQVSQVVAVEGHEASVLLGRINALQNNINNILFIHRSAEKYIQELNRFNSNHEQYPPETNVIILDPPRTGMTPPVVRGLLNCGAEKILYISCNPVTLANDLKELSAKYVVRKITGIDMFPDISHVETVVMLEKK